MSRKLSALETSIISGRRSLVGGSRSSGPWIHPIELLNKRGNEVRRIKLTYRVLDNGLVFLRLKEGVARINGAEGTKLASTLR